jgi:hypothetical protein
VGPSHPERTTTCSCVIMGYRACNCGSSFYMERERLTANQQARIKAYLRPCNWPRKLDQVFRRNHAPTR